MSQLNNVNVDEAVLTGKIQFKNRDFVLILLSDSLVFREFATENEGFTISTEQIVVVEQNKKEKKEIIIEAILPRSLHDNTKVQTVFHVSCPTNDEAEEWIENIRSVLNDIMFRKIKKAEEESVSAENKEMEHLIELKGMFPDLEDDIIKSIYESVGKNLGKSIETLLSISDPSYQPSSSSLQVISTEEQMKIDEQLAIMLQDGSFLERVNKDTEMKKTLSGGGEGGSQNEEQSLTSKLQEMSFATKRKFMEFYHKLKNEPELKSESNIGEELMPLKDRKSYDYEDDEELKLERSEVSKDNITNNTSTSNVTTSNVSQISTNNKVNENNSKKQKDLIDFSEDGL